MTDSAQHRRRNILIGGLSSGALVLLLIAIIRPWQKPSSGWPLWDGDPTDQHAWEALKLLLEANAGLLQLAIAGIGALAFLLSYNRERGGVLPARAWGALTAALVALWGCLLFAILGREMLLNSLGWGVVNPEMRGALVARWGYYACLSVAGLLLAFFGYEVAFAPTERSGDSRSPKSSVLPRNSIPQDS